MSRLLMDEYPVMIIPLLVVTRDAQNDLNGDWIDKDAPTGSLTYLSFGN